MSNPLYTIATIILSITALVVILLTFKGGRSWKRPLFLRIFCMFFLCRIIPTILFYLIPDRDNEFSEQ